MHISSKLLLSIAPVLLVTGCRNKEKGKTAVAHPNILLVINDDQSFAHTSFSGSKFVHTPGFDRIAVNGVYFMNCYAGSPGSAPSRGTLVTGRHHWQNEQSGQHASSWLKKYVPFVDLLEASGYHTGYTGKGVDPFQYARNEKDSLWRVENAAGKAYNKHKYKRGTPSDLRTAKGIGLNNYFENFKDFMQQRKKNEPFYFWYGSTEPHRGYEKDSWERNGKKTELVDVPGFLPDSEEVRKDLLDYAVEIEWADSHLVKMLNYLDSIGELENTIVVVTADNGMPFPRAKANCFEFGAHVPLAISYPKSFPPGRIVNDPVGFVDLAPTLLELAGVSQEGMLPIAGKSFVNILTSKKTGTVDEDRKYVFSGRERHSSSRWKNLGYPQRAIRSRDYLLIWNMKPERWPAGAPQAIDVKTEKIAPMYGLDENGVHHSDWAFTDVDASPTKSYMIEMYENPEIHSYFELAFLKRPEFELYDMRHDPYCLKNLSGTDEFAAIENEMKRGLLNELKRTSDPRIVGPDKEVFDSYIRYSPIRDFPEPDWLR